MASTYIGAIASYLIITSTLSFNVFSVFTGSIFILSLSTAMLGISEKYAISIIIFSCLILIFRLFSSFYVISSRVVASKVSGKNTSLKAMLSQLHIVLGLSGTLAPLGFSFLIARYNYSKTILMSSALFFIAMCISISVSGKQIKKNSINKARKRPFENIGLLLSGLAYFVLAGMLYSFIPLLLLKSISNGKYWTSFYLFLNSSIIVSLSYFVIKLFKAKKSHHMVFLGFLLTFIGLASLRVNPNLNAYIIIFSAVIFSLGEIICSVHIQNEVLSSSLDQLSSMAEYNLFCSGFGLGAGQYLGAIIVNKNLIVSLSIFLFISIFGSLSFYQSSTKRIINV
ncbi:hypothetical protein MRY82_08100 [bacterium]|nr:hypothetical protein [bacterium]